MSSVIDGTSVSVAILDCAINDTITCRLPCTSWKWVSGIHGCSMNRSTEPHFSALPYTRRSFESRWRSSTVYAASLRGSNTHWSQYWQTTSPAGMGRVTTTPIPVRVIFSFMRRCRNRILHAFALGVHVSVSHTCFSGSSEHVAISHHSSHPHFSSRMSEISKVILSGFSIMVTR